MRKVAARHNSWSHTPYFLTGAQFLGVLLVGDQLGTMMLKDLLEIVLGQSSEATILVIPETWRGIKAIVRLVVCRL